MQVASSFRGHWWTIAPHVGTLLRPPAASGTNWSTPVLDERFGEVRLTGVLHSSTSTVGANNVVIIVHGMSSSCQASYVVDVANRIQQMGLSTLRLNLRGADRSGAGMYHAGLVADLEAVIASTEIQRYDTVHLLGFSLGGHLAARYAVSPTPKVASAIAICSPLDLCATSAGIGRASKYVYRQHLLRGVKETATAVEKRYGIRLAKRSLSSINSIWDWDNEVVAPNFGFSGAPEYYRAANVADRLEDIAVPTLLVYAKEDPMILENDVHLALERANQNTEVRWYSGGHVHFPRSSPAIAETLDWLQTNVRT